MHIKSWLVSLALCVAALNAWAAATVQTRTGDVNFETKGRAVSPAVVNQRLDEGATVHTGSNGQAMLRFDDGQLIAISPNSTFKIDTFKYDVAKPEQGSVGISLLKGALRMVTGLIGQRNASKVALNTPTATIGIRGTDFMVALVNPVYMQVLQGGIAATNTVGTVAFASGTTGMVASATTLATTISATALPAAVSATFAQMGSLSMVGGAGAASSSSGSGAGTSQGAAGGGGGGAAGGGAAGGAGAGAASAGAFGGIGIGAVAVGAAVAAVVAASASTTEPTTGTTGTTGTQ